MKVVDTPLKDVKIIEPKVFGDERGFFMETFRQDWFKENVADIDLVQDNHSLSRKGTLRGLHYQSNNTQGKLVRVTAGEVFDVAVDLRQSSTTFGKWFGIYLSSENKRQLWVPEGFAHGFYVTSEYAEFCYRCSNYYHPESEISLKHDDKYVGIEWPFNPSVAVSLSDKDKKGLSFSDVAYFK
ncbi:MAG: dTDP-4-dehydrorhamnose 3,5-epimerase [Aliiglaciecola sp.]